MNSSKRKVVITDIVTHRYFSEILNNVKKRSIKCAFNLDRDCSPDCASCDIGGSMSVVFCVRNGLDNSFAIGMLEEEFQTNKNLKV